MLVELVTSKKPESFVPCDVPTLISETGAADAHADPIQGKYNCLISRIDDQLMVWDIGAGGGTFVNGIRVSKAVLKSGDTLRLGGTEFSVKGDSHLRRYLYGVRC